MRSYTARFLRVVLVAVLTTGCSTGTQPLPTVSATLAEQFTLRVGQTAQVAGTPVQVTFLRVTEDQRCPINLMCVWAGYAKIAVRLVAGDATFTDTLDSSVEQPVVHGSYALRFLQLEPGRLASTPIGSLPYVATLIVNRWEELQ